MKNQKLVGILQNEDEAIKVIKSLKAVGYKNNEISIITRKRDDGLDELDTSTSVDASGPGEDSKAMGGMAVGGVLGGIAALLLEVGVIAIAIPGVGPLLAAGPIAATLGGLVSGGAVGGIAGALVEIGIDEVTAKEYETYLNRGDILVTVDVKDNLEGEEVLECYGDNCIVRDTFGVDYMNRTRY